VTPGEFRDISFDTISIGDIYMLETLPGRTDKDGGKIGASMAIFFKTAEPQVPGLRAVDQKSTEEELFGNGESQASPLDMDLDLNLNNGVRIGRVTNLLGIEKLDQINSLIESHNDTGTGDRPNLEVGIDVKDCGSQNKGNFFRWLGLTGF
jgi:hypothetical protein